MSKAKTLLQFLTQGNPDIEHLEREAGNHHRKYSVSNTNHINWLNPRALREWKEFSPSILESIYQGKLMAELLDDTHDKQAKLPGYPYLSEYDCIVIDENTTTSVLTKWNHTIVTASLVATNEKFHPCFWNAACREPKEGNSPALKGSTSLKNRWKPDAGAVSREDMRTIEPSERLPKDYKVAKKWRSRDIAELLHEDSGEWKKGGIKKNEARPIRQAYTYCVSRNCRYGCIITTEEAFIFRIKPMTELKGHARTRENLVASLGTRGLMEYISVPWDNVGFKNNDTNQYQWTINLALWFLHILAGNHYEIDWNYDELEKERLAVITSRSPYERSKRKRSGIGALFRDQNRAKRVKSNDNAQDGIHLSFQAQPLAIRPIDDDSSAREQSEGEEDSV